MSYSATFWSGIFPFPSSPLALGAQHRSGFQKHRNIAYGIIPALQDFNWFLQQFQLPETQFPGADLFSYFRLPTSQAQILSHINCSIVLFVIPMASETNTYILA